jgi:putative MATE family efflux protein
MSQPTAAVAVASGAPAIVAPPQPAAMTDRRARVRQAMLQGAILPTLFRLAWPTVTVLVVQTFVGIAETYYVSYLGTEALAGVTLVFPVLMLMAMMSNGGIGGGVSSAIARAIGAGRRADADALVLHSLVISIVLGLVFTGGALLLGPALYRALGGGGRALDAALTYSFFVFIGSVPIWVVNLLASALRGAGNVKIPALVIIAGAVVTVPLSPIIIFGFGPVPHLGIAGAGIAVTIYYVGAAIVLLRVMASGRTGLTLRPARLQVRLFRDILGVGLISAVGTLQSNLTVVLVTGFVGAFGADALAGYGMGSRLDYLLIPLVFGLGTSVLTMVGINIGAGQAARARHIAWIGALVAAGVTEAIGLFVAFFPQAWLGLFSHDPAVLATGTAYLRIVAPVYGATGFGMLLYFASQGAGSVIRPFLAGTSRLLIATLIGGIAVTGFGVGLSTLFAIVAASSLSFGLLNLFAMRAPVWRDRRAG